MRAGRRAVLAALALAFAVAACGSSAPTSPIASTPVSGSPGASASVPAVSPSAQPGNSVGSSPSPREGTDGAAPSAPPASSEPSSSPEASAPTGPAAACSGSDDNRGFYAALASSVAWTVYCAVLPAGWYVDSGSYQLAGGGHLEITYKGPDGSHLALEEGVYCTDGVSACSPLDQHLGPAKFGDLDGELGTLGDGFVIYVDPGSSPSWQAEGTGLDQATFVALAAALAPVR